MKLQLPRACDGILVYIEGKYLLPVLHVKLTKKKQTAQLSGLFTEERLQMMMEGRTYCAFDNSFPCAAAIIDRGIRFVERCDLTGENVLYFEMANKILFSYRGGTWVESELRKLRPEILKLKSVVEKTFVPHCCSGSCTLKFHLLDHFLGNLKRFRTFFYGGGVV